MKKISKVLCLVDNFTFVLLQVVDAYLAFIVQAEIEKGNNITMYPSQTMTSIMSGNFSVQNSRKKVWSYMQNIYECRVEISDI